MYTLRSGQKYGSGAEVGTRRAAVAEAGNRSTAANAADL
jgi:hypothetical protein